MTALASAGVPQTLSAVGPSLPVAIRAGAAGNLPPSILCLVSAGATLAYTVEVTGDTPLPGGGCPDTATWFPLDASTSGLAASQNAALGALVTFVRVRISAYTSGTLTFEVVQ